MHHDLLVLGNSHLGPSIWQFSLPAVATCPGATPACLLACYARKFVFTTATASSMHRRNLERTTDLGRFTADVITEIRRKRCESVRVHVAGDFFSKEYVRAWATVARRSPKTIFMAYTRSWRIPAMRRSLVALARLPNVRLFWSEDRDSGPCTLPTAAGASSARPPRTRGSSRRRSSSSARIPGPRRDGSGNPGSAPRNRARAPGSLVPPAAGASVTGPCRPRRKGGSRPYSVDRPQVLSYDPTSSSNPNGDPTMNEKCHNYLDAKAWLKAAQKAYEANPKAETADSLARTMESYSVARGALIAGLRALPRHRHNYLLRIFFIDSRGVLHVCLRENLVGRWRRAPAIQAY